MRDDARLPPRHVSGGHRHPEPRTAKALHRSTGVRRELLRVHRRGGTRTSGRAGSALDRRGRGACRPVGQRRRRRPLQGQGPRSGARAGRAGGGPTDGPPLSPGPGPRPGQGTGPPLPGPVCPGPRWRRAGQPGDVDRQRRPDRRHAAGQRDHPSLRRGGTGRRHHHHHVAGLGRPELRRLRPARGHHAADRRRQRLSGQGSLGGPGDPAPTRGVALRGRGADRGRQRHPLRCHRR